MEYIVTLIALAVIAFVVVRAIRNSSAGHGGGAGVRIERDNNEQV